MLSRFLLLLCGVFCALSASAFSPYENYLETDRETHVGLIAAIADDQLDAFETAFQATTKKPVARELKKAGIRDAHAFTRNIEGTNYAVIHFAYDGSADYLGAAEAFEKSTVSIGWSELIEPHPRAVRYGRDWLQMEWINFIHGFDVAREPTNRVMIGCRIRPEKEAEYRTLHQTVWPGVVDQAVRGKIRNLNIFLVELGDDLVEFLYLEYMGSDQAADDAANQADPINQRWWKLTDACQMPFPDVEEGIWASLDPVDK